MTKYIEELDSGDCFVIDQTYYLLTKDFKKNGDRLGVSLIDGNSRWFNPTSIVNSISLYTTDKDSNIIAIKPTEKPNHVLDKS